MKQLSQHEYPSLLNEIPEPPKTLFLNGSLPPQGHKLLAVVGARKYTEYGKQSCISLIRGLAGAPISIISGLALGIDGIAHRAALDANLHTLAVPGSGLGSKVLYPSTHRKLANDILKSGGGLLSEFPPDFKATPYSFPQRNRIMAGMSHAILVIEAEEKSGTLITSRLAVEYNRDVLTIPHPIHSPTSRGPHMLLRLGATLIRDSKDILEALNLETDSSSSQSALFNSLSPEESRLLTLLREPMSKEELITQSTLPVHQATILLTTLELKGLIHESNGLIRIRS